MRHYNRFVNGVVFVLGLAMIAYYLLLGLAVRFGQSLQFLWPVVGGACVLRSCIWRWMGRRGIYPRRTLLVILRSLLALLLAVFFAVEGIIFAGGLTEALQGLDYIVVLGARVDGRLPSGALRNRIERATAYLRDNPSCIAVLSGGQGEDEEISEAQCMYEQMQKAGIAPERLLTEECSRDTSENLLFSRELIPEGAQVGIVTNNFHIFRALALARGLDWTDVHGVPVSTSLISYPHYMMREFVGVLYDGLRGHLALCT